LNAIVLKPTKTTSVITSWITLSWIRLNGPVGGHLKTVFEKGQEPAEEDHADQGQVLKPAELLFHLQVPVPGAGHEDV